MFLPLFIAILLGLATPTNTNNNCSHNGGTVTTISDTSGNLDDPDTPPQGDGTGGDTGNNPPR